MGTIRKLLSRLIGSQTMAGTIILGFLLIFLPLSIAVGVYTIGKVTDSLEETTQRNLTTLAEQVSEELDRALFGAFQDIQTLATNPVISSSEASDEDKLAEMKKSQDFYDQLSEYYSVFLNVTLIDLEGQEIISTDESVEPQENWADRKVFSQAREGAKNKTWVSPPYPYYSSDESSEVVMAYASPVVDNSGNTIAVIIGRMDMVTIWEITDGTTIGEEGFTRIIDGAGNIYAHPDKEKLFSKFEYFDVAASMDQYVTYDESGEKIVAAYAALEGPQWYVIVSQPQNEAFALVEDNIKEAIWVAGALFLLFIVIIIVLISRLTRPIHTLSVGAEAIGSGNLAHRVPISGSVETRRLATSFNEMSGNLQKAERLRAEHVLLRKLQAASLALASALSPDEVLRIISNGVRDILSCDIVWVLLADEDMNYLQTKRFTLPERDQMVDEHISLDSMSQKKIDLAGDLGLVARVFNGGNPLFIDDLSDRDDLAESDSMINALIAQLAMNGLSLVPLRLPDRSLGIMIFGRSSDDTLSDEEKRVILVFAHQATISLERARLHDQDMQSTAELVRLNDLKSRLLHVLSHELKTPLTSLKTSTRLLQETDLAEMDKRTQQRLMGSIARATDRLIDVADDIYPIAGVMTGGIKVELRETDCRRIVDAAVEDATSIAGNKEQIIDIAEAPSECRIVADKERMRQVLAELLTNAGKFSPEQSSIEIKVHDEPSQVTIDIKDQGIGISDEDKKSIFDGFYQADSEIVRRAGGRGLGLLFAKTIVERHHGKIWVDSNPGEGSNFHVSIPKKE